MVNPPQIKTGYTFPKLCKLLHTDKSLAIAESEYINALVVKTLESVNPSVELLDEVDFFLDRYFTTLSSSLSMSQEDVDALVWHLVGRIARSVSNVSIRTKSGSKSKKDQTEEEIADRESIAFSTCLAIRSTESLISCCSHLVSECNYKQLTVCVVNELLLIDQYRIKGLEKLPGSPYVDSSCRMALLLLLRSLTLMTNYMVQNPLQVSLAIFDKFALWDTKPDLSIIKLCEKSICMLRLMIRTSEGDVECESEPMIQPEVEVGKSGLSPIVEEEEEVCEEEEDEGNSLAEGPNERVSQVSQRSESVSSCYATAANSMVQLVDLEPSDEEASLSTGVLGSTTVLQPVDMELTVVAPANKTFGGDKTTFEIEDMSFDQSALVFDQSVAGDTVDIPSEPPAKRVCSEQENSPENVPKVLNRTDTYTLLPEKSCLVAETMPQMELDPICETVEDILKSANLDL